MADETLEPQTEQEVKEITALTFDHIFGLFGEQVKTIGQLVFVEDEATEGFESKSFNIVRALSDGSKQLFKVTVEEAKSLKITK